ncbi:MAG: hypothetical protein L3J81_01195 [Thermoplasmata archaeon]|jgi:uncharacterized membrane protein|nr:hypothetical protein [Thermoplasmata archaeon]
MPISEGVRMRPVIVVVGIVLLIVGAVLLFEPVVPQANQTITSQSSPPIDIESVSGYSVTGAIAVHIAWTSVEPVTVVAATCSANCNTTSTASGVTLQSGTSGSFTLNQPNGGEIAFGALNLTSGKGGNATFTISTALATVGTLLVVVGILLVIAGIILKSDQARAKAAAATQAAPTPATPTSGDSGAAMPPTPPSS